MKKNSKILPFVLMISMLAPLFSCEKTDSRWEMSEEDMENTEEGTVYSYYEEDGTWFALGYSDPVISRAITANDIKIIDKTKAKEYIAEKEDYNNLIINDIISKYTVPADQVNCDETLTDVTIQVKADNTDDYAILINKDVTTEGVYVYLEPDETLLEAANYDSTLVFEETYCSKKFDWEKDGKFCLNLLKNLASVTKDMYSGKVGSAVGGIGSILSSIKAEIASHEEVTLADTLNKINQKIDTISNNLTKNFNTLQNEAFKTQLKIDQSILLQYQQAITDFNTNYVYPVDNFNTFASNQICTYIVDAIKGVSKTLDLWFYKDSDGNWQLSNLSDIDRGTMSQITFNIDSFSNAEVFLDNNSQTIKSGFNEAIAKDFTQAASSCSLLDGMTADDLAEAAYANFMETMIQKYFVDNPTKSTELQVLLQNESYAIYGGGIGTKSIVDDYVERLKYMYNFNNELKPVIQTIFAKILTQLDNSVALASLGLGYNHLDTASLAEKYKTARDYIQNTYTSLASYHNNYCFATDCDLSGEFYAYGYSTKYSNIGNNPTLTINTNLEVYTKRPGWLGQYYNLYTSITDQNPFNRHNWLDYDSLKLISARYAVLINTGLADSTKEFIDYLHENEVLSDNAINACRKKSVYSAKYNRCNRIFTGISNERDLTADDTSMKMRCMAGGTSGSSFFNTSSTYNYASSHGANHWKGHLQESRFFDGVTGAELSDTFLASYATFDESRWYWNNDEHYAFCGLNSVNETQNTFFGINKVAI